MFLDGCELGPGFRCAAHMRDDQSCVMLRRHVRELRIERQPGRIVDDGGAVLQRLLRHGRLVGIDGNRNGQLPTQALQHRNQAAQLFGFGNALGTGLSGLRADVDDIRALLFQFDGARERTVRIQVFAAVGKGIRRHVQHAHQQRALAQQQFAASQLPDKMASFHAKAQSVSISCPRERPRRQVESSPSDQCVFRHQSRLRLL